MSQKEEVRYERRGAGAWVVIDRPEAANSLSVAVVAGLRAALTRAASEKDVRAVVLTGTGGKAFCAGADLKERRLMSADQTRAFLDDLAALMDDVARSPRPTLAAVDGVALGGGTELALAADLRIASDRAVFGLPEVRLGILPGAGGTQRLPRLIGAARAKEMILLGRRVDASRALNFGLVGAVVPSEALEATAAAWVEELAGCAPLSVANAKRAIDEGAGLPLEEGLALERAFYETTLESWDRQEGLAAFAEKRKPRYEGR